MELSTPPFVALLEAEGPSGTRRQGVACIVSPGRAITAARLVEREGEDFPGVWISSPGGGERVEAIGVALDLTSGLAAFPFPAEALPPTPPLTVAEASPQPGERWSAWVPTPEHSIELGFRQLRPVIGECAVELRGRLIKHPRQRPASAGVTACTASLQE
jgi:hypothetical protein